MREGRPDRPIYRHWYILALVSLCINPSPLPAQIERPEVRVSLYFVGEAEACRPAGYPSGMETSVPCEPLTFQDLEAMVRRTEVTRVQHRIPPEQLRLGEELLDSIDAYREDCPLASPCLQPNRRYAVILAFEVDVPDPVDFEIAIRRKPPPGSRVKPYSATGALSARGRWINHQRADVFLPAYGVRWQLDIGSWSWDLGATVQ